MDELQATPPSQCGLALALPTDLAAIASGLSGGRYADYVSRGLLWGSAAELWANSFRPVAESARSLASHAKTLGVNVRENATIQDLAALFGSCRVVTVVAHWRGPQISRRDIIIEPAAILDRLAKDPSDVAVRVRSGLPDDWRRRSDAAQSNQERRSRLAELLDDRMSRQPALAVPPPGTEWYADAITLRHMNRAAFDAWWPGALNAGNRLELADGLHSVKAISTIVPQQWAGIADFSNCQSAQLIDEIKQYRSDRIVIANEGQTNPVRRLELLKVIYDLLSDREADYVSVRTAMAEGMRRISC